MTFGSVCLYTRSKFLRGKGLKCISVEMYKTQHYFHITGLCSPLQIHFLWVLGLSESHFHGHSDQESEEAGIFFFTPQPRGYQPQSVHMQKSHPESESLETSDPSASGALIQVGVGGEKARKHFFPAWIQVTPSTEPSWWHICPSNAESPFLWPKSAVFSNAFLIRRL